MSGVLGPLVGLARRETPKFAVACGRGMTFCSPLSLFPFQRHVCGHAVHTQCLALHWAAQPLREQKCLGPNAKKERSKETRDPQSPRGETPVERGVV